MSGCSTSDINNCTKWSTSKSKCTWCSHIKVTDRVISSKLRVIVKVSCHHCYASTQLKSGGNRLVPWHITAVTEVAKAKILVVSVGEVLQKMIGPDI
jgi:hypothetical protein